MNSSPDRYDATAKPTSSSWVVPNRIADPRASVWSHRWLAAGVTTTVTLLGVIIALLYGHATYEAEATIRISPTSPAQLARGEDSLGSLQSYRAFVQQQVYEIDSYGTISAALDRLGPKRSLWQRPDETDRFAAERLMDSIKIEAVPDSYFITVSLTDTDPDGLAEIVNAVVNEYLKREAGQELNGADEGTRLLERRRGEIQQLITNDQTQLSQLAQTLGIASFEGANNPYDKELRDESAAAADARLKVELAQARLDALKSHQSHITALEITSRTEDMLASNPETVGAKQQLMEQREAALLELSRLGPAHPDRLILNEKIARINDELAKVDQLSQNKIESSVNRSESAKSGVSVSRAEADLDEAQRAEEAIRNDLDGLRSSANAFGVKYSQGITLHDKIAREGKELQDIDDQRRIIRLERLAPGFVSLDTPALTPDFPQKGKRRKIAILFGLIGLVLAVAVPTAVDLTDPRIGTAAELEAILGFPLLGATLMKNGRLARDSLRRIALGIRRERRTSGIRTYVLTPVRGRAGTTTLALALASELCDLGVPAIAIEANPGAHDHRYGSKPGENQFSRYELLIPDVRVTRSLPRDGAATTKLSNADRAVAKVSDLLPAPFSISKNLPGASLSIEIVRESIETALQLFDVVLIDAPPLLTSADPVLLLQTEAAAILVVRAGRDERSEIAAAARELERLSPPVVGAILNTGFVNGSPKDRHADAADADRRDQGADAAAGAAG